MNCRHSHEAVPSGSDHPAESLLSPAGTITVFSLIGTLNSKLADGSKGAAFTGAPVVGAAVDGAFVTGGLVTAGLVTGGEVGSITGGLVDPPAAPAPGEDPVEPEVCLLYTSDAADE